jgi:hypothetical protein
MPLKINRGSFSDEEKDLLSERKRSQEEFASDMSRIIRKNADKNIMYQTRAEMINPIVNKDVDNVFNIFTKFDSLGKFVKKSDLLRLAKFREDNPDDIAGAKSLLNSIIKNCDEYVLANLNAFTTARRYANKHFDTYITGNSSTGYSDSSLNDHTDNMEFIKTTVTYLNRRLNDWNINLTEFMRKTGEQGLEVSASLTNFLSSFDMNVMNEKMLNDGLRHIDKYLTDYNPDD